HPVGLHGVVRQHTTTSSRHPKSWPNWSVLRNAVAISRLSRSRRTSGGKNKSMLWGGFVIGANGADAATFEKPSGDCGVSSAITIALSNVIARHRQPKTLVRP